MSKNDLGRPAKHPFCVTFPCRGCKNISKPQNVCLCWQSSEVGSGPRTLLVFIGAEVFSYPLACVCVQENQCKECKLFIHYFKCVTKLLYFFWQLPGEKIKTQKTNYHCNCNVINVSIPAYSILFFSFSLVKWTKIKINVISLLFWIHSGEKISISLKKKTKMKRDIGVAVPHRFAFHLPKLDNRGWVNSHYFHRINRDSAKQMYLSLPVCCNGITHRIWS